MDILTCLSLLLFVGCASYTLGVCITCKRIDRQIEKERIKRIKDFQQYNRIL